MDLKLKEIASMTGFKTESGVKNMLSRLDNRVNDSIETLQTLLLVKNFSDDPKQFFENLISDLVRLFFGFEDLQRFSLQAVSQLKQEEESKEQVLHLMLKFDPQQFKKNVEAMKKDWEKNSKERESPRWFEV